MKNKSISSASTTMVINASKENVWDKVGFYEHVQKKPSWMLRFSLPTPQEVDGKHEKVGDTCRCKYSDGGYLTKRITRILDGNRIEFEIIEQSIRYQDSIKLLGGYIEVEEHDDQKSIVNMVTYYENRIKPKRFAGYFINKIIKTMHKFVMQDMQAQLSMKISRKNMILGN